MLGKLALASALAFASISGLAATQESKKSAGASPAAAAGGAYGIDDVHSNAFFRVQHAGAGQFWGRFNQLSGTMTFDAAGTPTAFDVSIAVDSVDSGEAKLDGHLKSPDFFNAKEFPALTFKSTSIKKAGDFFDVSGDLSMHGVTKPVTARIEVTGISQMMGSRAGVEATFSVKRSEFGMTYGVEKGMIGDEVRVLVNLEGVKK